MTKTNKNGTTAYHLIEAAKKLGLNGYGIRCSFDDIDLNKITLPLIAYTVIDNSYKHFVVIYEIDKKNKNVVIGDPMTRVQTLKFDDFKKIYRDILLIFNPKKNISFQTNCSFILKVKQYFYKNLKYIFFIIFLSIIFIILNLICLSIVKYIIDINNDIYIIFMLCLLIELLKSLVQFIRNTIIIKLDKKINFELTSDIFNHILTLPYNFYRNRTTGEIVSRLNDLEKSKKFINNIFISVFVNCLLIITSMIFLIAINRQLFIITFLILVIYVFILLLFKNNLKSKLENIKIEQDKTNSYMIESIMGFESIKGLNLENKFQNKFKYVYNQYLIKYEKLNKLFNLINSLKDFINNVGTITILFIGMILVKNNVMTIGELLIYNLLTSYFLEPIKDIFDNESNIREMMLSFRRISDLYYDNDNLKSNEVIKNIEIKNLNYTHNDLENILQNIELKIKKNEKILIVGPNGSGKSTFLKLIKGYYKSDSIYSNGIKLDNNKNIIYVSQNEFIFTDTLYNNVVLNRNILNEEFDNVSKICHLNEIIKNNDTGYNMLLEENGFNISGGEKQRIIIARALLSNADVILFDESFSEIDVSLERKILKDIFKYYKNKIILLVSHKKDNLDLFEKLFVFDDKKINIVRRETNV